VKRIVDETHYLKVHTVIIPSARSSDSTEAAAHALFAASQMQVETETARVALILIGMGRILFEKRRRRGVVLPRQSGGPCKGIIGARVSQCVHAEEKGQSVATRLQGD